MINLENIKDLVGGNHVAPYLYNNKEFIAGKTPVLSAALLLFHAPVRSALSAIYKTSCVTVKASSLLKFIVTVGFNPMLDAGSYCNLNALFPIAKPVPGVALEGASV